MWGMVVLAAGLLTPGANATVFTLTDAGTSVAVGNGSASNWMFNAANWLDSELLYYRIGTSGATTSAATLTQSLASQPTSDTATETLTKTGAGAFKVKIDYSLSGGTESSLSEQYKVTNTSGGALNLQLFTYTAMDLGGLDGGQTVTYNGVNGFDQSGPYTAFGNGTVVPVTITGKLATKHQTGDDAALLTKIQSSTPTLTNNTTYTGDPAFAFEWDLTLAAGATATFTLLKGLGGSAVPEPMSLVMLGTVLLFVGNKFRARLAQ